jgi:ketohexokinase
MMIWDQGRIPDVTLQCIRYLRQRDSSIRISVEVEKPGRPGLQELAAEADVVVYSKGWAQVITTDRYSSTFCITDSLRLSSQANGYRSAEECIRAQAKLPSKAYVVLSFRLRNHCRG